MFVDDNPLDILAVNETKLDSSIPDSQVCLSGYSCIRNDRTRSGGGVCIYIRNTIIFTRILELDCFDLETLQLKFETQIQVRFYLVHAIDLQKHQMISSANSKNILNWLIVNSKKFTYWVT